jgi:hypothetical protein
LRAPAPAAGPQKLFREDFQTTQTIRKSATDAKAQADLELLDRVLKSVKPVLALTLWLAAQGIIFVRHIDHE